MRADVQDMMQQGKVRAACSKALQSRGGTLTAPVRAGPGQARRVPCRLLTSVSGDGLLHQYLHGSEARQMRQRASGDILAPAAKWPVPQPACRACVKKSNKKRLPPPAASILPLMVSQFSAPDGAVEVGAAAKVQHAQRQVLPRAHLQPRRAAGHRHASDHQADGCERSCRHGHCMHACVRVCVLEDHHAACAPAASGPHAAPGPHAAITLHYIKP